jgi:nicotinate-nucleotide adenylyltransferase
LQNHYRKKQEAIRLFLLLSEDALDSFDRWKEAKEIVQIAEPLIGWRKVERQNIPQSPVRDALLKGLTVTKQFDISSTQIRNRLKKGLYCGQLVPEKVLAYIKKHRLYL